MPRQRNPKRDEAHRIWIKSNKTKPLKDIANILGVSASTVRKWKSEDKWSNETKRSAPNETERYESMRGNQNAKENRGGAPPNNKNAVTHGLFANWLPEDTRQLVQEIYSSDPADIIWNNIMIQYAGIIRSQKIMFVSDQNDLSKEESGWSSGEGGSSSTMQVQYAWDKQANFMNMQSRAMGTLANLIRQFNQMANEDDKRRLELDIMTSKIEKAQVEIRRLKIQTGDLEPEEMADDGFIDAIKQAATDQEVWGDDDNIET
ncbi:MULTISPECIES: phage terminase small subunit [Enterococcus]|jgi:uncharacterized protein YjcR|uniref:phage terminase small subunit n=1 Tax=Enterococcus TaxID=1350 RepID=UPI000FF89E14|nr:MULTISPECIES: phage terminase small subunit [Enterococcus]MDC0753243.1 phage terminase small subunit [Enterococcus innesii]MDC0777332.1 phage terminase small subunit [Enterococcus innesii]MDC0780543.1 phage terminase small subunit [Enterococcus innesii]MDC0784076.1 phage terminase small subunit [Enterococcus innesii]RXA68241.1 TerS [Enterococcus casseliflavus]